MTIIIESLEKFVEKASRPGVLGLPGRKIEKKTRAELGQYFERIGAEIVAMNLQDRVMHNAEAARHVVDMALHNVLRKNRQLLRDTLQSNMEKAYLTALKLDYLKESVEDEPRDEKGRWSIEGTISNLKPGEHAKFEKVYVHHTGKTNKYHVSFKPVFDGFVAGNSARTPKAAARLVERYKKKLGNIKEAGDFQLTPPEKLDYLKESVEDEPRDDHGRWTDGGNLTSSGGIKGNEKAAKKSFYKQLEKKYPNGVLIYHESPIKNLDSISKEGVKPGFSADTAIFGTLDQESGFVSGKKVVAAIKVKPKDYSRITPDMRYNTDKPYRDLMRQHPNLKGADVMFETEGPIRTSLLYTKEAEDFQLTPPETTITDTTSTLTQNAAAWAEQNAGELVTGIDATTADLISNAVADGIENQLGVGGIGRAIKDIMDSMSTYRAESIASTEINRAMSAAAFEKMDLLGIEYKQIILSDDACPICEENAAADPLPIDEDYPSGDSGSPFHPNCRCAMTGARAPQENS